MTDDCGDSYYLDDTWSLYFHDPGDPDWTTRGYVRLPDVASAQDLASVWRTLRSRVTRGMFFLMREHIFPCWDDKYNIDGGAVSVKLPVAAAEAFWWEACVRMLGGTLARWHENRVVPSEDYPSPECVVTLSDPADIVNGLSISPKASHAVVKVWLSQDPVTAGVALDLPRGYYGEPLYRANRDIIACARP